MDYQKFLQKLKNERIKKGISLREIGEALGKTRQQVYSFESGRTPLKVRDYFLICEVLHISPRELLEDDMLKGDYRMTAERLSNLSKRDLLIIGDLITLMELKTED